MEQRETLKTVIVENEELLRQPLAAGRVIVSLPHAGNWDNAGAYFCVSGAPLVTVAEHLKPRNSFRKLLALSKTN
jgi:KDO2-lipid IV(A) lauroyltransferase